MGSLNILHKVLATYFWTNPGSMWNKWDDLETLIQSYTYDTGKNWWDESYEWGAMGDTYGLFVLWQGTGVWVTLFVIEGLECMELTIGNGTAESIWIRIKGQINNADIIMGN